MKMFDWGFFFLLFATGLAGYHARLLNQACASRNLVTLPPIALEPKVELTITLISIPVSWSTLAVLIYGFFILPWNVLLICLVAAFIAVPFFHLALRSLPGGYINPFTAP